MRRRLVALSILQALDLATTYLGLAGGALERNPVGQGLLGHGFPALIAAKALAVGVVALIAWLMWRSPESRWQAVVGLQIGCALMVAVVGWNSWVLLLHAG